MPIDVSAGETRAHPSSGVHGTAGGGQRGGRRFGRRAGGESVRWPTPCQTSAASSGPTSTQDLQGQLLTLSKLQLY